MFRFPALLTNEAGLAGGVAVVRDKDIELLRAIARRVRRVQSQHSVSADAYLTRRARQATAALGKIQARLQVSVHGLLPPGSAPSWRRGIWL